MFSTEALYKSVKSLQEQSRRSNLLTAMLKTFDSNTIEEASMSFFAAVDEAQFEVENCVFAKPEKQIRYRNELSTFRGTAMASFLKRDQNSVTAIFSDGAVERLGAIADAVSERLETDPADLDRIGFLEKTAELIEEVKAWDMDQYASRTLLMGLGLVAEVTSSSNTSTSDAEIRRRISRIVAAFAVEFSIMDKEFESRWETIKRWAKLGYKGSSVPLALTSDAAGVAGLLPKP